MLPICNIRLTTWVWSTYKDSHSWRKLLLPFPAAIDSLWLFNQGWSLVSLSSYKLVVDWYGPLQAIMLLKSYGHNIPVIPRRHYFTAVLPVPWLLQSFCPLLWLSLGCKCGAVDVHWGMGTPWWLMVGTFTALCNSLCLLENECKQMKIKLVYLF